MSAEPFEVSITEAEIADLRERLRRTRWPEREPVGDWSQGLPLAYAQELCRSWVEDYDFGFAKRLNVFTQYRDTIDGLGIHFLHVRSPESDAFPLVLTHGWPGSVLEFQEVIGPLTDPRAHGGDPADAFHVVAPSLPGYGWSDKPSTTGWGITRTARAWDTLMVSLGYQRYGAQGGDWGPAVSAELANLYAEKEMRSWPMQQFEATAYKNWEAAGSEGDAPATPTLDALLEGRNGADGTETLSDLVGKVYTLAQQFIAWQVNTGIRQRGERMILDATTPEEAQAVTWSSLISEETK